MLLARGYRSCSVTSKYFTDFFCLDAVDQKLLDMLGGESMEVTVECDRKKEACAFECK
jgi:hypothetical protein